ncbi:MAG TPA: phosphoadenylyl-sulfate reductase [Ilumatobacter sp.]|nr:phosphoadenylyl-sulfate reductase [Ilumatobacter sp.]
MYAAPPAELADTVAANVAAAVAMRPRAVLSPAEVEAANAELEQATPSEIVAWAHSRFGAQLVLTASFADTTLIDLATAVAPDIEVIFLDTGFHFAETLNTVRRAMERYALNLTVLRPDPTAVDVWAAGSEACCEARKVAPLADYLPGRADAWLSGLRRADSPARADAPIVSIDRRGLVKINPMANMTDAEYAAYQADRDVIVNTLAYDGYASIGCWPCTEKADDRSGRWAGSGKSECGLHL